VASAIDPSVAVELRELLLRVDEATAIAAEAEEKARAAAEQARSAEAAALRLLERLRAAG
jgi:hypothetical protein